MNLRLNLLEHLKNGSLFGACKATKTLRQALFVFIKKQR